MGGFLGQEPRAPTAETPLGKANTGGGKDPDTPEETQDPFRKSGSRWAARLTAPMGSEGSLGLGSAGGGAGEAGSCPPLGMPPVLALGMHGWGPENGVAEAGAKEQTLLSGFCDWGPSVFRGSQSCDHTSPGWRAGGQHCSPGPCWSRA